MSLEGTLFREWVVIVVVVGWVSSIVVPVAVVVVGWVPSIVVPVAVVVMGNDFVVVL